MLLNNLIAVVIPCFNEQDNISKVIQTLPDFVDYIIVIDDASVDGTVAIVKQLIESDERIRLLELDSNSGVGAAISAGYIRAVELDVDVAAVLAGDGQMDPDILLNLIWPIINGETDFTKSNRLFDPTSESIIPKHRYVGNFILSLLTKIASGYWKISDAQSGYTAIGKKALKAIKWKEMYPRYGQPNDLLISLNINEFRVADVFTPPRYDVGEKSKMKIRVVIFTIPLLLLRGFFRRLWSKYIVRNSHPIVLLYFSAMIGGFISFVFFLRLISEYFVTGDVPILSTIIFCFTFLASLQSTSFAMWFDLQLNDKLQNSYTLEEISKIRGSNQDRDTSQDNKKKA
jgi:glycosyltransferase involved in cell wall biosynthesis